MWQEMNNSVMGSVLGRMFGGARAMKSLFSDLLPAAPGHTKKNPATLDLRPTEMTRVKYIIRNPHTHKPMKIIKMRPSAKKVVKLRGPLPKPGVVTESTSYSLNFDQRMRQLEKEQELIAEGKAPLSSDEDLMDKYFRKKPKGGGSASNQIVTGKNMHYQSWKPVYKSGEQPSSFVTLRPQALTQLHTDISASGGHHEHEHQHQHEHEHQHELLPKPEKLVSYEYSREEQQEQEEEAENEVAKQMGHRYEVTEHTGEASGEFEAVASMESGFVPSKGYRSQPQQHQEHHSQQHQEHHSQQQSPRPRSRGSSTTSTTTSTTEAPNYPPSFLKKYREREAATTRRPRKHQHKQEIIHIHHGGGSGEEDDLTTTSQPPSPSFSMSSMRARLQEQQRRTKHQQRLQEEEEEYEAALVKAMHGDKWPTEVQGSGFQLSSPIGPSAVAFEQPLPGEAAAAAKYPHPKEHKRPPRANIRERGSVKFGDKPSYEDDEA
ncbi:putative mediator of RNA polymerase II transcription subunit 26 isoform X2 [Drosophila obscura]|nr:putative mediator of RNA polymerase II transcription subunit 26 isoform X2 [Drosophila obscura]